MVGSTPYFLRAVAALAAPGVGGVATLPPAVWRCVEVCGGRGSGSQALVSPQLLRDSVMCDV